MPLSTEGGTSSGKDREKRRAIRICLGALVGVVVWVVVVTVCDRVIRRVWVDYAQVEKSLAFTLSMMLTRLSESTACSVLSGFVAALISKERIKSAASAGVVLLAMFLPLHISIWSKFPPWYHLYFLTSLPVFSLAGGLLSRMAGMRQK